MTPAATGFRRLWLALIALAVATIVVGSLLPDAGPPAGAGLDKILHFLAYLSLTALGAGIVDAARVWRVAMRCLLLGVLLEGAQAWFTETRDADWGDLLANAAGVAAAWLLAGGARAGWARHVEAWIARRSRR